LSAPPNKVRAQAQTSTQNEKLGATSPKRGNGGAASNMNKFTQITLLFTLIPAMYFIALTWMYFMAPRKIPRVED
jgi:hypothetical protein